MADQLEMMKGHIVVWRTALNLRMLIHMPEDKALQVLLVAAYVQVSWEDLIKHAQEKGELVPLVAHSMILLPQAISALDA